MRLPAKLMLCSFLLLHTGVKGQVLLTNSFDGVTAFPVNPTGSIQNSTWFVLSTNSATWTRTTQGTGSYTQVAPHTGSGMAQFSANKINLSAALISGTFSLNNNNICAKAVSFWIYRTSSATNERVDIRINNKGAIGGSVLLGRIYTKTSTAPAVAANGWYQYSFAIPATFNSPTSRLIINGFTSSTYSNSRIYIDDVSVEVNTAPPVITSQPPHRSVCPGQNASFNVVATGLMNNYQWQFYNGTGWSNVTNTGIYSGATTATLLLTAATAAINNYRYRCIVSNSCTPPTTSDAGILSVAMPIWYQDSDGDGWGNPSISLSGCAQPAGYVGNNLDCNDTHHNGSNWNNTGAPGFSAGQTAYSDIAIDNSGVPYVVYADGTNNYKATVKKYNGSAWVTVGVAGFSSGQANYARITTDGNGIPYVVYCDVGNNEKATVMKYNGTAWVPVGAQGFSALYAAYTQIAIDPAGIPYVVYKDGSIGNKAIVKKFNGSAWVTVGTPGTTTGNADYTSITIDKTGIPYIASLYSNSFGFSKVVVMKYDGTDWMQIGPAPNTLKNGTFIHIKTDDSGIPYLVYSDGINSKKATVMKYDGSGWLPVGIEGFSVGRADFTSLAIDAIGTPYVAFTDYSNSQKATVMKYNGTAWVTVGTSDISAGATAYTSIAVNKAGIPYLVYRDAANGSKVTVKRIAIADSMPTIITQPAPITICSGGNATYTVAAKSTYGYQWQVSTNGGSTFANLNNNSFYTGATTASLHVTAPPISYNNYQYRCVLTGTCTLTKTTNAASLTINTSPAITSQPVNKTICPGSNASFSVSASGTGLTYRWKVNSGSGWINVPNSGIYSGVTSPTLVLTGASTTYSGYKYRCLVSGTCTPAVNSAAALLTVNPAVVLATPSMIPNPAVAGQALNTIYLGYGPSSVVLSSAATGGTPGYTYSWTPATGVLSPAAASTSVAPVVATTYTLKATDTKGCSTSANFTINVIDARSGTKVIVCHGGVSKAVASTQVPAHLAHGDKLGPCTAVNALARTGDEGNHLDSEPGLTTIHTLKVYPNPNNGIFIVDLPENMAGGILTITDMSGRLVQTVSVHDQTTMTINLNSIANGVYMLQVRNNDKSYQAMVTIKD